MPDEPTEVFAVPLTSAVRKRPAVGLAAGEAAAFQPAGPGRRRLVAGGLAILVGAAGLAVGGYAGYQVADGRLPFGAGAPATTPTAAGSGRPGAVPALTGTATQVPGTPNSGTAAPGTDLVQVAPALVDHPETAEVRRLFDRYFTAINQRDYPAYRAVLVPGPRLKSEAQFRADFASTLDSSVRLLNLRADGTGGLVTAVDFVSQQAPDAAPGGATCLHWVISYRLVRIDGALRIDVVRNREPDSRPC